MSSGALAAAASPYPPGACNTPPSGAPPSPPIGEPINLEQAKRAVAAAEAEGVKRNAKYTIAVVDPAGFLVYYQKASGAPYIAEDYAVKKARAAAKNRRPTTWDVLMLARGYCGLPWVPDAFPFPGGVPIVREGKMIGAIGMTGGAGEVEAAEAGAQAVN